MRILYIITQGEQGGGQKHVLDLAKGMIKKDYEVFVATGRIENESDTWLEKKIENNFLEIKILQREINISKDMKAIFEILKVLRKIKPDILHLHSSKAGFVGALAGFIYKIFFGKLKIIYTVHGFVFLEPMNFLKKYFYSFLEFFSSFLRDFTILISEKDLQVGKKFLILRKQKNYKLIYNGLDKNLQTEILNKTEAKNFIFNKIGKDFSEDTKIVGTVANFYKTKGLEFLIDSAQKIVKEKPKTIFVVFGSGEDIYRKELEKRILKNGLENNFFLLGKVENAFKYLKGLDIFALTSLKEGLPYCLLEAKLSDIPIVASRVGGISEMAKNFEINLVKPGNADQIAKNILKVLEEEQKVFTEFPKIYSLENMLEETEKVYKNVLP